MPVDFSALVLAPNMSTFAVPITITPVRSQPGQPAYVAEGIWSTVDMDVMLEDGSKLASTTLQLGIRLADFAVLPQPSDQVTFGANEKYLIDIVRDDGQGGGKLILKSMQAGTTNLNRFG